MKIFTIVLANVFNGFLSGRFLRLSVVGFWGQILGMNWIMVCVEKPQNPQKELDWTEWFRFLDNVKNDAGRRIYDRAVVESRDDYNGDVHRRKHIYRHTHQAGDAHHGDIRFFCLRMNLCFASEPSL